MRSYPKDEYDMKELQELNADNWMIEYLHKNPDYVYWGNYEDYMTTKNSQWGSPIEIESINNLWKLDDLNELINFYFEVSRSSIECPNCEGSGLNKETKQLKDDWYDFSRTGRRWDKKITQDEVDALWDSHRLHCDFKEKPTAEQVNTWSEKGFGHDSINHSICVRVRAKRLGIYGLCEHCGGNGVEYQEEKAHLSLQMWFIHPRKGASRGVYLKNIEENELPLVIEYLKEARERNTKRFSKL